MKYELIETKSGKIRGHFKQDHLQYLGIPYAKPPVGSLRFRRACPAEPWEGIFDANDYGAPSVQLENGEIFGSEDCLTLNIQRPVDGDQLPVMVWIHGGGFNTGSASVELYHGDAFIKQGILFVSIQYRLNVLGFYDFTTYKNGELFDSNCGISDQILAIQWIHENIAAFGGDPNRVTIAGESAGGTSVSNMLAIPSVKGMFQQAIVQSAIAEGIFTHQGSRENIDLFLEGMGWTEDDLPRLLTMDPKEMQKGNTYVAENFQKKNPGIFLPSPVIDDLIPVRPVEAICNGSAQGVRVMIGTTLHEGSMFVQKENTVFPNSWEMIREMFEKNDLTERYTEVETYYTGLNCRPFNGISGELIQFATDYGFQLPAYRIAEGHSQYGKVWMYRYEFIADPSETEGLGAGHAFELPSVFYNPTFEFSKLVFEGAEEEVKERVMNAVHNSWVNFIKDGNPDAENWPEFQGYRSLVRVFDQETENKIIDNQKMMQIWGDLLFYNK